MKKIVLLFIIMPFFLSAGGKIKVAVMPVEDNSELFSHGSLENTTEILRGKLSASGSYIIIDKSRQNEKLKQIVKKEKKESYKKCYDKSCQIPLGQALSSDSILRSSITCLGTKCTLSCELVDLAKEAVVEGGSADFQYVKNNHSNLLEAIDKVVAQLSKSSQKPRSKTSDLSFSVYISSNVSTPVRVKRKGDDFVFRVSFTPSRAALSEGTYIFTTEAVGFENVTKEVLIKKDTDVSFFLNEKMVDLKVVPVDRAGTKVEKVSVYSKGKLLGTAPAIFKVPFTTRRIVLKKDGYDSVTVYVPLKGENNEIKPLFIKRYRPYKWYSLIAGGAGLAALGAGVYFDYKAEDIIDASAKEDKKYDYVTNLDQKKNDAANYELYRNLSYGAAAGLFITGTLLFLIEDDEKESQPAASIYVNPADMMIGVIIEF